MEFRRDWAAYRAYNEAFAAALAEESVAGTRVLIQDYHLALAPRMLRDRRPDARIAHFEHTPWAPPEYYRMLPDEVAAAILDGMLGADHAGFLAERWASAFLDCCEAVLGARVMRGAGGGGRVSHRGRVTDVAVHPLGVDAAALRARAADADVRAAAATLTGLAEGRQLIVRVDRTELSKNIVRGLDAYRELLAARPEWRGKVTHLAFAYPSRSALAEYRAYTERVHELAGQINAEFGRPGLAAADPRGQGRLPEVAGGQQARRRAAGQPDQGRHEPGGRGGADPQRARLRPRAVPGGGRRRPHRRRRAARQPLRRDRDRGRAAHRARHARLRAPPSLGGDRRRRAGARPAALAGRAARRALTFSGECPARGFDVCTLHPRVLNMALALSP